MQQRNLLAEMRGRWVEFYNENYPELSHAIDNCGKHVPCPLEGGKDGFSLFKDVNETGGGVKENLADDPIKPSGISLLKWLTGKDGTYVARSLYEWLDGKGYTPDEIKQANYRKPVDPVKMAKVEKWLKSTWNFAKQLESKHYSATNYLKGRKLGDIAMESNELKFAFGSYMHDGENLGKFPMLVAKVSNNDGELVGLHRTYLDKNGKLDLITEHGEAVPARKLTSSLSNKGKGRMIRLFPAYTDTLHLAEGIETALSVYSIFREPTWSLINASNFKSFVPPRQIRTIHNWIDKDKSQTGERAAVEFRRRMEELGIRVIDHIPPVPLNGDKSVDWNDVLVKHSPSAFFI